MAESKFLRVRCECGNEQIIFSKSSTEVKCFECEKVLTKTTGGKAEIMAEVVQSLE
ncbi:MAG: 30S ribosomal protein S27e [Candidatus Aenigmarchaeota archaeon]|nr:30S ribosomal protein S27e [Candidatus Aenigmarchaeota archaeon]